MQPEFRVGDAYGEAFPGGPWISVPETPLLYIRARKDGAIVGKTQEPGNALLKRPGKPDVDLGTCVGVSPVAFGPGGFIYVSRFDGVHVFTPDGSKEASLIPGYIGSQGIRYITATEAVVSGDATYAPRPFLSQWTPYSEGQIGQVSKESFGVDGLAVHITGEPAPRLIYEGFADFIRVNQSGTDIAITFLTTGPTRNAKIEGSILALRAQPILSPVQPPSDPPQDPMPDHANQLSTVQRIRASFPTPLDGTHVRFLVTLAQALGGGAGLLSKRGGSVVALPDGTTVSGDIICFPDGWAVDVLGDAEGAAVPVWDHPAEWALSPDLYVNVSAVQFPDDTPPDEPVDLQPILEALAKLKSGVETANRRITELTNDLQEVVNEQVTHDASQDAAIKDLQAREPQKLPTKIHVDVPVVTKGFSLRARGDVDLS